MPGTVLSNRLSSLDVADGGACSALHAPPSATSRLDRRFESTVPGIYVIGALAGYPLIKHCINQGYDVVEYIGGAVDLKPADEPILEARLKAFSRASRMGSSAGFRSTAPPMYSTTS